MLVESHNDRLAWVALPRLHLPLLLQRLLRDADDGFGDDDDDDDEDEDASSSSDEEMMTSQ